MITTSLGYVLNRIKEPSTYAGIALTIIPISQAIEGKSTLQLLIVLGFAALAVFMPEPGVPTKPDIELPKEE
jgi:hypothetical protein